MRERIMLKLTLLSKGKELTRWGLVVHLIDPVHRLSFDLSSKELDEF